MTHPEVNEKFETQVDGGWNGIYEWMEFTIFLGNPEWKGSRV